MEENLHKIGLYIHIPFCKAKCHYCDFNSLAGKEDSIPSYFHAMGQELKGYTDRLKSYRIKSIFIGGGTPSLVSPHHIYAVMSLLSQSFNVEKGAEISIEANPGTLTFEKLTSFRNAGINRLSMGLQAWQQNILNKLGRIHSADEFAENFRQARKAGFTNINVDLIFGIPGQDLRDWDHTLEEVIKLAPEHISCYSLKVEEGTVFGQMYEQGTLNLMDEELDREMYYKTIEKLGQYGYKHYEISNFAKPGLECKHNMVYWNAQEYIGVGAGAHSYFEGVRYSNKYDLEEYMNCIFEGDNPVEEQQKIYKNDRIVEFVILGLRLTDGISLNEFRERFGEDIFNLYGDKINLLLKRKLIEICADRIKLTSLGLDLANQVFVEFV